jgi:plastocyanin
MPRLNLPRFAMTKPWRRSIVLTVLLVGLVVTAGCGGSDATAGTDAVKEINVSVVAGTVTPAPDRIEVSKGQTVRITVRSDVTDVVHVHGYDKSAALMPDKPATVEVVADKDGLYEVETHATKLRLLQLAVS